MINTAGIIEQVRQVRSWEELISEGLIAREQLDGSQWHLGDLANEIETSYGENTIGKFAYAVGKDRKTMMNYRTIATKFEPEIREKYKKLSFSHFSTLTGVEKPEAWLEKADDEDWSVETLRKNVNEAYPKVGQPKLDDNPPVAYRCEECGLWRLKNMSSFDICRGHYKIVTGKDGKPDYKYS